ncbi:MAG TPA: Dabb family protein [Acidimicrobiales bacterium]|nr:Dabb family protein [Acidimicrobiales bacterium]
MIRRFEIYSLRPGAPPGRVRALETACGRCGRFIPEVLHGAVGWNVSDAPVDLVWEHAFASPDAYRRYMVHPYHAAVLDRYLLHDSPERVVVDNDLGAGLVGYDCEGPVFAMTGGVRRLVLLRLNRHASPSVVDRLVSVLANAPGEADQMVLSAVGANTLGSAWFDAVTPIAGRPRWTHLWEQGFASRDDLDAYIDGPSPVAAAERRQWRGVMEDIVERTTSVHYEIDGPRPAPG